MSYLIKEKIMKYYNCELPLKEAENLRELLYNLNVKFEISAAYNLYHFEILLDKNSKEFTIINNHLLKGAI